jgi:uncharacterized protein
MRIVLDTNILVSAIIYGGKPRIVHELVIKNTYIGITSAILLAELSDVLRKKFRFTTNEIASVMRQIRKQYQIVLPMETIDVVADIADNRVLEAAIEGECEVIITGDVDLLALRNYRKIQILNPEQFLRLVTR